jgi:hypothetical protein
MAWEREVRTFLPVSSSSIFINRRAADCFEKADVGSQVIKAVAMPTFSNEEAGSPKSITSSANIFSNQVRSACSDPGYLGRRRMIWLKIACGRFAKQIVII